MDTSSYQHTKSRFREFPKRIFDIAYAIIFKFQKQGHNYNTLNFIFSDDFFCGGYMLRLWEINSNKEHLNL